LFCFGCSCIKITLYIFRDYHEMGDTKPTNIIWGAASAMSLRNWIWYQLNHTTAILEYSTLAIPKKGSIILKLSADGGFTPGWYGSDGSGGSRWVKVGEGG
jgi:hypothetical protein